MSAYWQWAVLDPLTETLILARLQRPVAFATFGHTQFPVLCSGLCFQLFATIHFKVQAVAVDTIVSIAAVHDSIGALIADVGASPRDADRGSADWRLLAVERLHAALAFIAVNLLFDVDS
jgi:hypothetical protein